MNEVANQTDLCDINSGFHSSSVLACIHHSSHILLYSSGHTELFSSVKSCSLNLCLCLNSTVEEFERQNTVG